MSDFARPLFIEELEQVTGGAGAAAPGCTNGQCVPPRPTQSLFEDGGATSRMTMEEGGGSTFRILEDGGVRPPFINK